MLEAGDCCAGIRQPGCPTARGGCPGDWASTIIGGGRVRDLAWPAGGEDNSGGRCPPLGSRFAQWRMPGCPGEAIR